MNTTPRRDPNPIATALGIRPARWPGRARIFADNKLVAYLTPRHDERGTWEEARGPYNKGVGNPAFSATWNERPYLLREFYARFAIAPDAVIRVEYQNEPIPAVAE